MSLSDSKIARGLESKMQFETEAWGRGGQRVGGLDEAGRGPLAGPVVAACVVIAREIFFPEPPDYFYQIDDSKRLSPSKRAQIAALLHGQEGMEIGVGIADHEVIDRINILEATRLAMRRALEQLSSPVDCVLVDGAPLPSLSVSQTALIQGDRRSLFIGAASIVAKVLRDSLMESYDREFPLYGFAKHKGYGTRAHLENLKRYGPCRLHRRSFYPVQLAEEQAACP